MTSGRNKTESLLILGMKVIKNKNSEQFLKLDFHCLNFTKSHFGECEIRLIFMENSFMKLTFNKNVLICLI